MGQKILFRTALGFPQDVPGAPDKLADGPGAQFFHVFRKDKTDPIALAPFQRTARPAWDMVGQDLSPGNCVVIAVLAEETIGVSKS